MFNAWPIGWPASLFLFQFLDLIFESTSGLAPCLSSELEGMRTTLLVTGFPWELKFARNFRRRSIRSQNAMSSRGDFQPLCLSIRRPPCGTAISHLAPGFIIVSASVQPGITLPTAKVLGLLCV